MAEGTAAVDMPDAISNARPASIPRPIEAHGIIGDQGTAALVADDGTVGFLCWPGLDGPSVFAALLDPERGGAWTLAPALDGAWRRQVYLPDTNVLVTRLSSPDGVGEITDFMPFPEPGCGGPMLIRRVRVVRGEVPFRLHCAPRLDYGRAETRAAAEGDGVTFRAADGSGPTLRLVGPVEHPGQVPTEQRKPGRPLEQARHQEVVGFRHSGRACRTGRPCGD